MPHFDHERSLGFPKLRVAGVDEVGRGCLAGPVVSAAVLFPERFHHALPEWGASVQDSKLLEAPVRESLAERIQAEALAFAIGECAPEEIDSINIHHASLLSMKRALDALCAKLGCGLDAVVVDGKWIPKGLAYKAQAIVKGDQASFSIACASIVAKVHRDAWMRDLEARYPGYGWAAHKGYPTPQHKKALARLGLTPMHRRSFGPVAAVAQALQLSRG